MNWRNEAECRNHDPDIMSGAGYVKTVTAKRICAPCPVRGQCLDWAVRNDEEWGVWGGLDRRERRRFHRIGAISVCDKHGIYKVLSCFQCDVDAGRRTGAPSTMVVKVGGERREQVTEWVEQGYKDTEIAKMIAAEIGESVSPTTVTKARHRWGVVRGPRHNMAEVRAVYSSRVGFGRLTRLEKQSLLAMWTHDGHSLSEFQKAFRCNWSTVTSLAAEAGQSGTTVTVRGTGADVRSPRLAHP